MVLHHHKARASHVTCASRKLGLGLNPRPSDEVHPINQIVIHTLNVVTAKVGFSGIGYKVCWLLGQEHHVHYVLWFHDPLCFKNTFYTGIDKILRHQDCFLTVQTYSFMRLLFLSLYSSLNNYGIDS